MDPADYQNHLDTYNNGGQNASMVGRRGMMMFDYSLGISNNGNCFTCTFIQQFIVALSNFSAAMFMYFRAYFVTLMPLIFAIWIGWSTSRVMIAGGGGGGQFFTGFLTKTVLFFMLWTVMMVQGPTGQAARNPSQTMTVVDAYTPWSWFGPSALDYGMRLSNEIRSTSSRNLAVGQDSVSGQVNMNCQGIGNKNPTMNANKKAYGFAHQASEMACAIERIHIVGMASGVAMLEAAWTTQEFSMNPLNFFSNIAMLFQALVMSVFSLLILVTFTLSMIWFAFLILDVVVKVLIIAAISPILMILALLAPTRGYAVNAIKQTVGGLATVVGLGFIGALAFYLIANTAEVYNATRGFYDANLPALTTKDTIGALREFLMGLQTDPGRTGHIPMTFTTPWFHYMLLVSLSIYALGKKIISIIEQIIGAGGMAEMANNAQRLAVMGGALAVSSAYVGGKVGGWSLGKGAQAATLGAGAAGIAGSAALANYMNPNPFSLRGLNSTGPSGSGKGVIRGAMDMQRAAEENINRANMDTPSQP